MGKKISELDSLTDAQSADNTRLFASADPTTGIAGKMTLRQVKSSITAFKIKYVATGSEITTLNIATILGKEILVIHRESGVLFEVAATPDPAEFIWDGTTITLGLATNPGERFLILYKYA